MYSRRTDQYAWCCYTTSNKKANVSCKYHNRLHKVTRTGAKSSRGKTVPLWNYGIKALAGSGTSWGFPPFGGPAFSSVLQIEFLSAANWSYTGERDNNAVLIISGWFLLLRQRMSVGVGNGRKPLSSDYMTQLTHTTHT